MPNITLPQSVAIETLTVEETDKLMLLLEKSVEVLKERRAELVKAAGGRISLPDYDLVRVEMGDKFPNPKMFIPLLNQHGIPLEDACFAQLTYLPDPAKIVKLESEGRISRAQVDGCKRKWTQVRRVKRKNEESTTDGDVSGMCHGFSAEDGT